MYEITGKTYVTLARVVEVLDAATFEEVLRARRALGPVFPHDLLFTGAGEVWQVLNEVVFQGPSQARAAHAWATAAIARLTANFPERHFRYVPGKRWLGY